VAALGVWDVTAYTWTGNPCANGEYPYEGLCAVNGLPFGTVIYVDGWGYLTVADRGGMDGWYAVDIYLDSEAACWEYGRRRGSVDRGG
jgi:3D (Asp-Asp-Asp) domain-containing protein